MQEDEEKYYLSLLFEALGQIAELNEKIHNLEVKLEELSSNHSRPNSLIVENSNERAIPLTKNSFQELDIEGELSEETRSHIDNAVDYILRLGKSLSYINNK